MTRLRELLPTEDVRVLVDESPKSLTTDTLRSAAPAPQLDLREVALGGLSPREALLALFALDGRAERVLLGGEAKPLEQIAGVGTAPAGEVDTGYVLLTSGTTGEPKQVATRLDHLLRTTRTSRSGGTWGLMYGWSRFAGLQVVLQALASGGLLVAPDPSTPLSERVRLLEREGCDHLSATPSLFRALLSIPAFRALPLRQITLGGEIAPQSVLDALRQAFPGARITHIFASTETGVAFSVHDGYEGFPASYLEQPPAGVGLAVTDGTLRVRTETGTWVDTGDVVELRDGRFRFLGRASGAVNIGGANAYPEVLEAFLQELDGIRDARVWARPSPILGNVLVADVVLEQPSDQARRDIMAACRASLPRHLVPAKVQVVEEIVLNDGGKRGRVTSDG